MKKYLLAILTIVVSIAIFYFIFNPNKGICPLRPISKIEHVKRNEQAINEAFALLKARKDLDALVIFDKVLSEQPDNLDAHWGKAEVLRRAHQYKVAEPILNDILRKNPKHYPSLISLSHIRYQDNNLKDALKLANQVLDDECFDRENQALAYMMLGTINSGFSSKGWIFSKIKYGTRIKCYFLKAKDLAPDLPEIHLGLGTFYLLAPSVIGGNLDKALKELELAVKIAPDFATANVRLAQCYKKKQDIEKYNFYIEKAKNLDPQNEVLKEIKDNHEELGD